MQIDVDIAMKRLLPEMVNHTCNLPVPASGTRDQSFIMTHGGSKVPSGGLGHSQVIRDIETFTPKKENLTLSCPPFTKFHFVMKSLPPSNPPPTAPPKVCFVHGSNKQNTDQVKKVIILSACSPKTSYF